MAKIESFVNMAFQSWYRQGLEYTKGIIKKFWLVGPRPKRLAVVTGNLRNRVDGRTTAEGFTIGTKVEYGRMWEKGIKAHTVTAKNKRALAIPVKIQKGMRSKRLKAQGILRTGKLRGIIFRKSVRIPAQAPRKWLEPGVNQALPEVMKMGHSCLGNALKTAFPNRTIGR